MAERTTTMRLRSVRFKDGRAPIVVIHPRSDTGVRDRFRSMVERIGGNRVSAEMAGYAIVAWSRSGLVTVDYHNGAGSLVSACAVPQYAKDCLLAEQAVRWSRDD